MGNPAVRISKGRARPFWFGCPVVFSGSVAGVVGNPLPGGLVDVLDDREQLIGRGFYNPNSSYRVRIVSRGNEDGDDAVFVRARIRTAAALRARLGLPSATCSVYRLVNSEGDGLSGLTIDIFDRWAVVMESALWASSRRDQVREAVRDVLGADVSVVFRVAGGMRGLEGISAQDEGAAPDSPVSVLENGLRYSTMPGSGQKTGFYADQRENRMAIRRLVPGATVLDLFCFSAGFGLNAVAGGAAAVTSVDSSADALQAARANAEVSGFSDRISFVQADVMEYLRDCGEHDVVICDPPKLAGGRASLEAGLKHYGRLNAAAMRSVADGGILVTCSCSSAVRRDVFIEMIRDAAGAAGRHVSILDVAGAGADHPVNPAWTEGEYLKVVTLAVHKTLRA